MKNIILIIVLIGIGAVIAAVELNRPERSRSGGGDIVLEDNMRNEQKAKQFEAAKEISSPDGFINTPSMRSGQASPITINELIGKKVILVDFWTYSCINCQRTTPYLNAWYEKYKDKGLEIIGIHTPEFEFEKEYDNVKKATEQFNIKYPVVLDNDYSTWNAYRNRYWPRKYLIDIDGFIVYDHIGEGAYEETERKIQETLDERMKALGMQERVDKTIAAPEGVEKVDATKPRSPEIYFGAWRNLYLGNGKTETEGPQTLTAPTGIKTNILYLTGDWNIAREYAENTSEGAKIIFRYQAEKVFMVASAKIGAQVQIMRDGKPVGAAAGSSVESDGKLTIQDEQLYRLIEDPEGYGEHTLEIIIEDPGLQAFTFTFG